MDKKQTKQLNAEMSSALFSETERFEMLIAAHWKKAAVAGVAIALVAALAFVGWSMNRRAATRAAHAFADATEAPALEKALGAYGTRDGAIYARQRLVQLYIDAKNYDGALKQLKLIAADPRADGNLRGRTKLEEAYVLELSGRTKEAAAAFSRIAGDANCRNAVRLEACAAAGRLLAPVDASGAAAVLARGAKLTADSQLAHRYLNEVKSLQLTLENGELGAPAAKPVAKPAAKPAAKAAAKPAAKPAAKSAAKPAAKPAAKAAK